MPHPINIHDGARLFLVRGKRTRHEVFAERGKPAKIVMPISEAGFLEVEKPADPWLPRSPWRNVQSVGVTDRA